MHKGQEGNGEDDKEAGDDDDDEEEGGELMVTAACLERGSRTGLSVLGGNDVNGQYTDILRNTKLCFILLPEQ